MAEQKMLSIRVSEDIDTMFKKMSQQQGRTYSDMFEKLISKYGASKQGDDILNLEIVHARLSDTCKELEQQLFDVFCKYSETIERLQCDHADVKDLRNENDRLYELVIDLQEKNHQKDKELAEQKEMINYLAAEIEKQQKGE